MNVDECVDKLEVGAFLVMLLYVSVMILKSCFTLIKWTVHGTFLANRMIKVVKNHDCTVSIQ